MEEEEHEHTRTIKLNNGTPGTISREDEDMALVVQSSKVL